MSLRLEFCRLVEQEAISFSEVCRRFGVSRPTGYKWWHRYQHLGGDGLGDQSRRPDVSPHRTQPACEAAVLAVRWAHPTWGGRKIRAVLQRGGLDAVPSASTITAILQRHGCLTALGGVQPGAWHRFEHAAPNDLWQIDFKGHFPMVSGRCHPLSVLDDHSRFALGLYACANQQDQTVRGHLTALFRRYGLPWRILSDNGGPWGSTQPAQPLTRFSVWLLRLGIDVVHGRIYHPQTQGKIERFHRTFKTDLLQDHRYRSLTDAQQAFTAWRSTYNQLRPHEALDLAVPAARYQPSRRPFPDRLAPLTYADGDHVLTVRTNGQLAYQGHDYFISLALGGQRVALRPSTVDGVMGVHFAHHDMGELDLHTHHFTMHYGRSRNV